jgi:hydroxymethylpyrimidine/phosphomethylpyrimidine kinase
LTVSGSDPSGGAGLQVDLKTFQAHGVFGMGVVSLLTVQNTTGVQRVELLAPDLVAAQLRAVLSDIPPAALKTGSLGSADVIAAVADELTANKAPLVVDPVLVSKHGDALGDDSAVSAYREQLLPRATLVTPNRSEAERLLERRLETLDDLERGARELRELGGQNVLIKGGVLPGKADAIDVLAGANGVRVFAHRILERPARHGAGCVLSAAITACLALGIPVESAVDRSLDLIARAMERRSGLGHGVQPLHPFCEPLLPDE